MKIPVDNKLKPQNIITIMKTILHLFTLALLVLSPLHLCGQNFPPLDRAQTFSIHSGINGQNIGRTLSEVRQSMGAPTSETSTYTEGFGEEVKLMYGVSTLFFYERFNFSVDFAKLNDQRMFMRVNGVDIYVGQLAEELAEHFPKSWEAKRNSVVNPQNEVVMIHLGDVSAITIFIDPSTGIIIQILLETMLT